MAKAQGEVRNLGPIGSTVAANVKNLRGEMSYRALSERLTELGRPIPVLGLSRIESGARRVDADDLIALALALDVSPLRLLLPPVDTGDDLVHLADDYSVLWEDAWRWATGDAPLGEHTDAQFMRWLRQNRPHDDQAIFDAWVALVEQTPNHTVERDECGRVVAITSPMKGRRRTPDGRVETYEEMHRTVYDGGPGMRMPALPPDQHWRGAPDASR